MLKALALLGTIFIIASGLLAFAIWGGPLRSGALFLIWPPHRPPARQDIPNAYEPLHQGHVDVSTGLYIREDDDALLAGQAPFLWRRTYLSGDRVSRQFGIGATHNGEWYLIGDPTTFQWAELVLADGGRIHFNRTSSGTSYQDAVFAHTSTPTSFYGSRLGWTGLLWALRFEDGSIARFKGCGPGNASLCSLLSLRDPDGHFVRFNRDSRGTLQSIQTSDRQLRLAYDEHNRIISASIESHTVEYLYDHLGRLERVTSDGVERSYGYGSQDEMMTIRDPGRLIENTYHPDGRLARQVVHRHGHQDYTEAFTYRVYGGAVLETEVTENDGSHTLYRFDDRHHQALEIRQARGTPPITIAFERTGSGFLQALTVHCTSGGRHVSATVSVEPGREERTKNELVASTCE